MTNAIRAMLLAMAAAACVMPPADAQQLYKWVDKDGKVSYSDVPAPADAKDVKQTGYGDNVMPASDDLPYSVRDAIKRNPVTLYANACGELCDKARALLNARGIPYSDKNPETDPMAREVLKEATGGMPMPTLMMGQRVAKGFVESEWQDGLTRSGYPRTNPGIRTRPPAAASAPAAPAPAPAK